jgi:uncharacterized protein
MIVEKILASLVNVSLETAPWLLVGLVAAGFVRALLPTQLVTRLLGGRGIRPTVLAAAIGAPLPLCSCGVLPVAIGLRKGGASRSATASFLISTPETGLDSIALSYALLGPFLAIARPVGAVLSAIFVGLCVAVTEEKDQPIEEIVAADPPPSCCSSTEAPPEPDPEPTCCSSEESPTEEKDEGEVRGSLGSRLIEGLSYSFMNLLGDIAFWLGIGLLFAGVMRALVDPGALSAFGSGFPAMLIMLVAGVPLYICASASTPVAAGLIAAGISPGVAVVFLLAGPATNIGSIGVIRKYIGGRATVVYLAALSISALGAGIAVDILVKKLNIDIAAQLTAGGRIIPEPIAIASAVVLLFFAVKPVRKLVLGK